MFSLYLYAFGLVLDFLIIVCFSFWNAPDFMLSFRLHHYVPLLLVIDFYFWISRFDFFLLLLLQDMFPFLSLILPCHNCFVKSDYNYVYEFEIFLYFLLRIQCFIVGDFIFQLFFLFKYLILSVWFPQNCHHFQVLELENWTLKKYAAIFYID